MYVSINGANPPSLGQNISAKLCLCAKVRSEFSDKLMTANGELRTTQWRDGPGLALFSHEHCPIETILAWIDGDEEVSRDGLEPAGKVCRKKIETLCWKNPPETYRS